MTNNVNTRIRIASIGECMIELWQEASQSHLLRRTFGGDTLNTAVYTARCLRNTAAQVAYVTALGDDPFSDELVQAWQSENLNTDLVLRLADKVPGLYLIRTSDSGERSFYYWRDTAAARELLRCPQSAALVQQLLEFDYLYLSAITVAILDTNSRERLLELLTAARARGGRVVYDSNHRPRLWLDNKTACAWNEQVLKVTDIALPTYDDEVIMYGDHSIEMCAERILNAGVAELVIKRSGQPCLVAGTDYLDYIAAEPVTQVVDTTAAGDAFNAAYLSARICGRDYRQAAQAGHRLAAQVIAQPGAIISVT